MTPAARFDRARERARARGIDWSLSIEQYAELLASGACTYCGGALPTNGAGLDRLDNHRSYELDNVVACCRWCNGWHWRSTGFLTAAEMRAVFVLYRERHGVAYVWPVVQVVSRTGRASTRLQLRGDGFGGLESLVCEVLTPERLAELAQPWDGRVEIETLQRERGLRP